MNDPTFGPPPGQPRRTMLAVRLVVTSLVSNCTPSRRKAERREAPSPHVPISRQCHSFAAIGADVGPVPERTLSVPFARTHTSSSSVEVSSVCAILVAEAGIAVRRNQQRV
jgi:hypothetical protein